MLFLLLTVPVTAADRAAAAAGGVWERWREKRLASRFPDEPWRWRADWARGVAARRDTGSRWVGALLWNYIVLAALVCLVQGSRPEPLAFLAILPAAVAISHLMSAWRATEAAQTSSTIELAAGPARLGGKLRGAVRLAEEWPSDWVGVRLTCSAAAGAMLWEEEQSAVRTSGPVTFEFDLPADSTPTGAARWTLTLWSYYELSGAGRCEYCESFEVPVAGKG